MKNLNILIIEDESLLALNLAAKLQGFGINFVDFVCSFEEVYEALERDRHINLLIVDINLNDGSKSSGIELVRSLNKPLDVIYLTAYSDDATVASATQTVPLGYLEKPVNMKQLSILLKIASEKITIKARDFKAIDLSHGYRYDGEEETLSYKHKQIKLSGKRLELLKILIEKKGEFIPFKDVEERLYQSAPPSDSALRTLIYRLRANFNFKLIETEKFNGIKLNISA